MWLLLSWGWQELHEPDKAESKRAAGGDRLHLVCSICGNPCGEQQAKGALAK
jgi:hypothetical protein